MSDDHNHSHHTHDHVYEDLHHHAEDLHHRHHLQAMQTHQDHMRLHHHMHTEMHNSTFSRRLGGVPSASERKQTLVALAVFVGLALLSFVVFALVACFLVTNFARMQSW